MGRACLTLMLSAMVGGLFVVGCEGGSRGAPAGPVDVNSLSVYAGFVPERIDILPLTELVETEGAGEPELRVFVALQDAWGSQIKAPGVFRFELYAYESRSADPKGARLKLWEDVALLEAERNEGYWRDFLRAYEFTLRGERGWPGRCVLGVTVLGPGGRRLDAEAPVFRP